MSLRKTIFVRTAALLAALIFLCNIAMTIFIILQNREAWKRLGGDEAVFIASQSERPLLWDDQVAVHDLFINRKRINNHIEQIFIEKSGAPYAYTFQSGVPSGLLGFNAPVPGSYAVREVQDERGRVFYDVSSRVRGTDAVVHLLLSRKNVDEKALGLIAAFFAICLAGWVVSALPAWFTARDITREVEQSAQALNDLNKELGARVAERTTELSSANETLKKEIREREILEKEREDFFAMVTHDLKTPIAVIQGYADMIREAGKGLDQDISEMLLSIEKSASNLSSIVKEYLTVSSLVHGVAALNISPTDLDELVRGVVKDCTSISDCKGVAIVEDLEGGLPTVLCDQSHVQRALTNLIHNAVQYTPEGGKVSVCMRRAGETGDCVAVSVSDTGIGIPHDEQDKVFEKYYRSSTASGIKGSGLGLAVVKAVAAAHGGSIELHSDVGKGSTFTLKLPLVPESVQTA